MAIDRAFSLRGAGLVVTGTVHSGSVSEEQEVFVFPSGARARIRGLHAQNQAAAKGATGDRVALNLTGLEGTDIERGQWLAASTQSGHHCVVLEFTMLADFPRPLRHLTPVHAYHATSHTTGRLALLEDTRMEPGEQALVQLETDAPLLAKHGDRIVIRDYGLDRTLGGGRVVDNRSRSVRRRDPDRLASIAAYREASPEVCLEALLALGPVKLNEFQAVWDLPTARLEALAAGQPASRHGTELIADDLWQRWRVELLEHCEEIHRSDPTLQGLQENEFADVAPRRFRAEILKALVADGRLEQQSGRFRPRQHRVVLAPDEKSLFDRLKPLLDQPQPPSVGDIGKTLRMPLPALQKGLKALSSKRVVVQINDKRVYLPDHVLPLAEIAENLSARGAFSAREFRDAAGIGRNVAIDILEFFDARGFTRRNGDTRTVVGAAERLLPKPAG
jgi:selenocysteine-specific elongation factor